MEAWFLLCIRMSFHISFVHADLNILYPHFPCHLSHCHEPEKFIKIHVLKVSGNHFPWKVLIYQKPPIIHNIIFNLFRVFLYNFFTVVSLDKPSMFRSFSPRLIAIAGYSSRVLFSSSRCSSQILSSTKVLNAFVPEVPEVLTYLS